jgi:hypothetical protein
METPDHLPADLPHGDPTRNDVSTATVAVLGVLGSVMTFALIVGLMVVFNQEQNREEYAKQVNYQPQQVADLTHQQMGRLTEVRWVDRQKGIATVPIDRAMAALVDEIRSGDWQPPQGPPPDQPPAASQPLGEQPGQPAAGAAQGSNPATSASGASNAEPNEAPSAGASDAAGQDGAAASVKPAETAESGDGSDSAPKPPVSGEGGES